MTPELARRLFAHFEELRRWAPRVALVGPAFASELFVRHYGESLAGCSLLPDGPGRLLDLGSGAGFPGLVLAAARPDLDVTLVEPRERKWAFLEAAARRAGLGCRVLNARVGSSDSSLPRELSSFSIVTLRALRLDGRSWETIERRLAPGARLLLWGGEVPNPLPASFAAGRALRLPGLRRWIREYVWMGAVGRAG
jgi:16S rRNA (guanine527-N7)-methyltransferase